MTINTLPDHASATAGGHANSPIKLDGLTDDIISAIFEAGYVGQGRPRLNDNETFQIEPLAGDRDFAFLVSHISSRLRDIAISTSTLWTCISSQFTCIEELHLMLQRSKSAGLDISLGLFLDDTDVDEFMEL